MGSEPVLYPEDTLINVLDKGFIRLVEYLGSDESVVRSARVSYGQGTKSKRDDKALIRYLMHNQHSSPFEFVEFVFHIKTPIFIARQWMRHRTASINEISGRYSILKEEAYLPSIDRICEQNTNNKQGSGSPLKKHQSSEIIGRLLLGQEEIFSDYKEFLDKNLSREIARINLPLATFTEFYWKINLHNLFHFLKLRLHPHAQEEIRLYAEAILKLITPIVPISVEAFEDYVLNALIFSKNETLILKELIDKEKFQKLLETKLCEILSDRELTEFKNKLK
jgi:thymidylate synthase (FAD)